MSDYVCVTCNWAVDPRAHPLWVRDWALYRGGRLCPECYARLAQAKPGSTIALGFGWRLAVVANAGKPPGPARKEG